MANFLLDSVSGVLRSPAVSAIAGQLGLSEQQVAQGLQTSVATLGAGIASRAGDSGFVRQLYDLAVRRGSDATSAASGLGAALTPALPGSPEASSNNQFLSSLFGGNTSGISSAIASVTGLPASAISSVMGMAAPLVLGAIGTQIKTLGLDASGFGAWLNKQKDSLLSDAPAGVRNLMGLSIPSITTPTAPTFAAASAGSPLRFLWPVLAAVVVIGALWTFMNRKSAVPVAAAPAPVAADTTSTMAAGAVAPNEPAMVTKHLPGGVDLRVPDNGTETKLLTYLEDSTHHGGENVWFDFDRLLFETGSAKLSPSSTDQLHDVAAILQAYPKAKVTIGGYTDNTGNADANLKLSQSRATSVMTQLASQGVAADRMTAKGYGDAHPVGDNSTEAGRAQNRRISLRVLSQ